MEEELATWEQTMKLDKDKLNKEYEKLRSMTQFWKIYSLLILSLENNEKIIYQRRNNLCSWKYKILQTVGNEIKYVEVLWYDIVWNTGNYLEINLKTQRIWNKFTFHHLKVWENCLSMSIFTLFEIVNVSLFADFLLGIIGQARPVLGDAKTWPSTTKANAKKCVIIFIP